jgi:hypothetical protein
LPDGFATAAAVVTVTEKLPVVLFTTINSPPTDGVCGEPDALGENGSTTVAFAVRVPDSVKILLNHWTRDIELEPLLIVIGMLAPSIESNGLNMPLFNPGPGLAGYDPVPVIPQVPEFSFNACNGNAKLLVYVVINYDALKKEP